MNSPAEVASNYLAIGEGKTKLSILKMLVLGIFAGIFIALAGVGATTASAMVENPSVSRLLSGCIFPAGLAMVLVAGSELFTGNCLLVIPLLERRVKFTAVLRSWLFVYIGNLIGSLAVAAAVVYGHTFSLFGNALGGSAIDTAAAKVNLTFSDSLIRAILCNVLVCIAVWMSFACKNISGKILSVFFPIMLFVQCGYEHSIAYMYYVGAGVLALGNEAYHAAASADLSNLTWAGFWLRNLLPVTLGNMIGGCGVGALYWIVYLRKAKEK